MKENCMTKRLLSVFAAALTTVLACCSLFACAKTPDGGTQNSTGSGSSESTYYSVNLSVDGNGGEITSNATNGKLLKGETLTITLTPDSGYQIESLFVNNQDKTGELSSGKFTIANLSSDVFATAKFKAEQSPATEPETITAVSEMPDGFYTPAFWQQMPDDGGNAPIAYDGGVKFQYSNISANVGYSADKRMTFMLKSDATGSNGFSIRFRANQNLNNDSDHYVLAYQWGYLFMQRTTVGDWMTKMSAEDAGYVENAWNRFDIVMTDTSSATEIKIFVNGKKVVFEENFHIDGVTYNGGTIKDANKLPNGAYFAVKTWGPNVCLRSPSYVPGNEIKVACVGDSITYGQGASFGNTYPELLQNMLGSDYIVNNFGYPGGAILPQNELQSWTYSYWDLGNYSDSLMFNADVVLIMFGTNDAHYLNWGTTYGVAGTGKQALFKTKYEQLIAAYRNVNPNVTVVVAKPPKMYDLDSGNQAHYTARGLNVEYAVNPVVEQLAAEKGCILADILTPTTNHKDDILDGVHWKDSGYAIIANAFYQVIKGIK